MLTIDRIVGRIRQWWRRRYWTSERQLEHLRMLVQLDHRWLAHDDTASALTERYLAALAPDWYVREHEDVSYFRQRIGLNPVSGYHPCGNAEEPSGCWRTRCQLGGQCVEGPDS
jgi:hypothetical protein